MSRILITGGTGFIGSNLATRLIELGHDVIITGTSAEHCVSGARFLTHHLTGVDLSQIGKIDVCFHQAANNNTMDKDDREMLVANVTAPGDFLQKIIKEHDCQTVIYASTTAVYGNSVDPYHEELEHKPTTAYARSKSLFERIAKSISDKYKKSFIGLRYCNVYGPGEAHKGKRASMIHQICNTVLKEKQNPRLFEDGSQSRDWCYIKDVVAANVAAWEHAKSGVVADEFNIGSGTSTSSNRLVEIIGKHAEFTVEPIYIPNPIKSVYQEFTLVDNTKAKKILGWKPEYQVEAGINEYINQFFK